MFVSDPKSIDQMLMNAKGTCPNCHTVLTFKESAMLAKDNKVTEDAIMCKNCNKVFTVNLTPNNMSIGKELTQYDFNKNSTDNTDSKETNLKKSDTPPDKKINQKISSNKDDESIIIGLFYKKDKVSGEYRIAKTKTISIIVFFVTLLLSLTFYYEVGIGIMEILSSLLTAFFVTFLIFSLGWIVSYVLDNGTSMNNNIQHDSENNNNVYNAKQSVSSGNVQNATLTGNNQENNQSSNDNEISYDAIKNNKEDEKEFNPINEDSAPIKSREYYRKTVESYLEKESWDEAIKFSRKWTECYPDDDFAWYTNSIIATQAGLIDEAEESIINATTLNSKEDTYNSQLKRVRELKLNNE